MRQFAPCLSQEAQNEYGFAGRTSSGLELRFRQ